MTLSLALTLSRGEEVAICWSWVCIAYHDYLSEPHDQAEFLHHGLPSAMLAKPIKTVTWAEAGVSQRGEQGPAHRALLHNEILFSQKKAFN